MKGNVCKHVLFVFLKVLKVSEHSEFIYQRALLSTEVEEVFDNAPAVRVGASRQGELQQVPGRFDEARHARGLLLREGFNAALYVRGRVISSICWGVFCYSKNRQLPTWYRFCIVP